MSFFKIKRILVPVDLSETSLNALETAAHLASQHEASLDIIYVAEKILEANNPDVSSVQDTLHSTDVLSAISTSIEGRFLIEVNTLQADGNVAEQILRAALASTASLIVMGTHGASGFRKGFVGSTTYAVIKHAPCPVLQIPPRRKVTRFWKALFPIRPVTTALSRYDVVGSILEKGATLDILGLSSRRFDTGTAVLEKVVDEIRTLLDEGGVNPATHWGQGAMIADDVLSTVPQLGSDLLVVTSVLDVINKPHYIGPHAQRIINQSSIPVLSIQKVSLPVLT
jgi:nucleotide-binding universal stress UspA family protein